MLTSDQTRKFPKFVKSHDFAMSLSEEELSSKQTCLYLDFYERASCLIKMTLVTCSGSMLTFNFTQN